MAQNTHVPISGETLSCRFILSTYVMERTMVAGFFQLGRDFVLDREFFIKLINCSGQSREKNGQMYISSYFQMKTSVFH